MEQTASRKILIVDDDRLICWAIGRELAVKRLPYKSVGTGKECLSEIGREGYDVVFLDVHLPDANGIGLIPSLRRTSPETKVIVISGEGSRKNQKAAIEAGALQFLEKPFDLSVAGKIINGLYTEYPENRKAPRYHCNLRIWIRLDREPSPGTPEVCGNAEEIGPRGIRVSTVIPLEPGRTVWLRPIDSERPFSGFLPDGGAEVEWMQAHPPGYMAGLRYLTPAGTSGPGSGASRS
ncbi:MAG TPA: response regulator [Candidatus Deferrimicrobiaceae bacterium]